MLGADDRSPPRGELCALRWRHVDLDAGTLRIAAFVEEVPGKTAVKSTKTHQVRVVSLDAAGIALLRLHRVEEQSAAVDQMVRPDGFVFSGSLDGATSRTGRAHVELR